MSVLMIVVSAALMGEHPAFVFAFIVSGILAHSIGQSLARAQKSGKALKDERDFLEIKVRTRTRAFRQAEQEKISQLYRLADFGRLSSGIFHDLINPLTAISLNLEQIKRSDAGAKNTEAEGAADQGVLRTKSYLHQALLAAHKMEDLITGVKKQIQKEAGPTTFVLNKEIAEIIQILAYKTRRADVRIDFRMTEEMAFTGDAVKFGQIIINLLSNAIEASENLPKTRDIEIGMKKHEDNITITVKDYGSGISPENIDRIFEPYFSTKKKSGQGLGIGLALTKNIVEEAFGGTISVSSQLGNGSIFVVSLPHRDIAAPLSNSP